MRNQPYATKAPAAQHPYLALCECVHCIAYEFERRHRNCEVTVFDRLDAPGGFVRIDMDGQITWLCQEGPDKGQPIEVPIILRPGEKPPPASVRTPT